MASNSKTYTRICVDCGKVMQQVYQTKMRCPECAAQRKRLLNAQWQARHKEEIRSLTPRPSSAASRLLQAEAQDIAFRADVRAADAAGLSYGQYMAPKGKQKARRCWRTDELQGMMDFPNHISPMISHFRRFYNERNPD